MELIDYKEQRVTHEQVELLFNRLKCTHWGLLLCKQWFDDGVIKQTFPGTLCAA